MVGRLETVMGPFLDGDEKEEIRLREKEEERSRRGKGKPQKWTKNQESIVLAGVVVAIGMAVILVQTSLKKSMAANTIDAPCHNKGDLDCFELRPPWDGALTGQGRLTLVYVLWLFGQQRGGRFSSGLGAPSPISPCVILEIEPFNPLCFHTNSPRRLVCKIFLSLINDIS